MTINPAIVFILGDSPVYISEGNCGGGEVATISLAKAFSKLGYRTFVFGNIPAGDANVSGIEFINYGYDYNMNLVVEKLKHIGPYHAFSATLVHPFLLLKNDSNCLSKIIINHSPGVNPSGLEASSVLNIVDYQISVSDAQRRLMFGRGELPIEKLPVVKNGFDPEIFKYSGPEKRDFNRLVFVGRLEYAKGIETLIATYSEIKKSFPEMKLDIYGSGTSWKEATDMINDMCRADNNIKYHGVVPQSVIANSLSNCGLLLFPSISFESAGLAVLDAQASGCPVIANAVGGVPEYVFDKECGLLVRGGKREVFIKEVARLLSNKDILKQMSINCKIKARTNTWEYTARQILDLIANKDALATHAVTNPLVLINQNKILKRGWNTLGVGVDQLLKDHEDIMNGLVASEQFFDQLINIDPKVSVVHFWRGLIYEKIGDKQMALQSYRKSVQLSNSMDWQPLYWLTMLASETGNITEAGTCALNILFINKVFPVREQLEKVIEASGVLSSYAN